MRLLILAYKNLKRKKIRSFLTIGGVSIAVAVLVSLFGFNTGYKQGLNNDVNKMGFQVLVTAKGCPYEAATLMLKGGGGLRYMEQDVYDTIVKDERVDKITPQLISTVYDRDKLDGRGGISLYMGILKSYIDLKPWTEFKAGGWFSGTDVKEVIMGYEAAELEQRLVGDKVFISGKEEILTVVGIFERTGTQDDGVMFLPLKTTQRIFDKKDKITGIGIKLKEIEKITEFESDLYDMASIQVISMAQVKGTILNLISSARVLVASVAFIAIFVAIIGVVNTILMSVFERTREIGVLRAIGASRFDVFKLIWIETILICVLGGIFGSVIAIFGSNIVEFFIKKALPYAPSGNLVVINIDLLIITFLGTILLGILSGVYPAIRAANMRPIEAIRGEE